MSQFLSPEAARLAPYTPGEQPRDQQYIKLNTNESPFPPSPAVAAAVAGADAQALQLYSDPTCAPLHRAIARYYGLKEENVLAGNGSDEILAFAFRAFCGTGHPAVYADVTYGFYQAQTALFGLESVRVPLREDFSQAVEDYMATQGTVFLANPNAPTGLALPPSEIRRLLEADRQRLVVVDEAYVDFGAESCVPLIGEYDNLLVVQTMSKSRSLAGGRVGFALGCPALIEDLNRVKYSFNPYNVNRMSMAALQALYQKYGHYGEKTLNLVMPGLDGLGPGGAGLFRTALGGQLPLCKAPPAGGTGPVSGPQSPGHPGALVRRPPHPGLRPHHRPQMEALTDAVRDMLA